MDFVWRLRGGGDGEMATLARDVEAPARTRELQVDAARQLVARELGVERGEGCRAHMCREALERFVACPCIAVKGGKRTLHTVS